MITWALNATEDQRILRVKLDRQKFPFPAIREVVWALHPGPEDSAVPLHPPVDPQSALALIDSRRFSVKRAEDLWQTLWGMSSDEYFAAGDPVPPPRPGEQIVYVDKNWFFPYPTRCFAREAGDPKCVGTGVGPFFPRSWHPFLLYEDTYGVWVCRGCFDRHADSGDQSVLQKFLRGEVELAVLMRGSRRYERLSLMHGG